MGRKMSCVSLSAAFGPVVRTWTCSRPNSGRPYDGVRVFALRRQMMKKVRWKQYLALLVAACALWPVIAAAEPSQPVGKKGTPSAESAQETPDKSSQSATKSEEGTKEPAKAPTPSTSSGAAAPQAGKPGAAPSGAQAPGDGAAYQVRLRDLEQRVDELKEQIRRSHTRLSLLSDTILAGASGGGKAEIEFQNELSGAWHVVEAVFVLDGAVQYKKSDDSGVLAKQKEIPIFNGTIPAGDHTVQVLLKLRGHGFGVFSYLRGMEAKVTSDHSFTLSEGKILELKATAWEQGGPTTPVEEQPAIRFQQTIRSIGDPAGATSKSSTSAPLPTKKSETAGANQAAAGKVSK